MDTTIVVLACCLLALFPLAQAENGISTVTSPTESPAFNQTPVTTTFTPSSSTVNATAALITTEDTTQYTNTSPDQVTSSTESSTESASSSQVPQSPTTSSPVTNTTTSTQSSTVSERTTEASPTTAKHTSTPTTPHSTHTGAKTSASESKTQGFRLNSSEQRMTIVFSVILGMFVVAAMMVLTFRKCKHRIQYLHQPLNNAENTDGIAADGDTLVISGGLYDGHPIYDNLPPPSEDQSQFRLEFLH